MELFNASRLEQHWDEIKRLLRYCKESSSQCSLDDLFYEQKVQDLKAYLQEDKAFLFVAVENSEIVGFLWACELNKEVSRCFHVLYFAVLPHMSSHGIGSELLSCAEKKALEIGIEEMELNVMAKNRDALEFYLNRSFKPERITMKKDIMRNE